MVGLNFLLPIKKLAPFPWNFIGILPLAFGILLNLIADKAFTKNKTTVKPFEESTALITDGAFRISRNPMYLGMTFILLGLALLLGRLSPLLIIPFYVLLMDLIFIKAEEKMLEKSFRDNWMNYKRKVRRWI
ncbi:isoprenylcysteine carboxylmethyltransferase family protein [bacterium]|nr:isoprenylcysteine carboxylmethyltransferase family protein [bacterium]